MIAYLAVLLLSFSLSAMEKIVIRVTIDPSIQWKVMYADQEAYEFYAQSNLSIKQNDPFISVNLELEQHLGDNKNYGDILKAIKDSSATTIPLVFLLDKNHSAFKPCQEILCTMIIKDQQKKEYELSVILDEDLSGYLPAAVLKKFEKEADWMVRREETERYLLDLHIISHDASNKHGTHSFFSRHDNSFITDNILSKIVFSSVCCAAILVLLYKYYCPAA
jgi:hypothetical protein